MSCFDDPVEIAPQERHAGALDRHISAGPHRDADFGGGQGGGVIHAVAGHGDLAAFAHEFLDDGRLVLRQNLRLDLVDAKLARDRLSGRAIVAGHHYKAHALRLQSLNGGERCALDRVGDRKNRGRPAVQRHEDRGGAIGSERVCRLLQGPGIDTLFLQELPGADHQAAAIDDTQHPLADGRVELGRLRERQVALRGGAHDGVGERMLARPLQTCGEPQDLGFILARRRSNGCDRGPALGERTGLIDHEGVDLFEALKRFGVLDQNAGLRPSPDADHD